MSNSSDVPSLEKFVKHHDSVDDIFEGPPHDTILGVVNYWLAWGVVGLFLLFTLFYGFQKVFIGTCRWEVLYVAGVGCFVNLITVMFESHEPMTCVSPLRRKLARRP